MRGEKGEVERRGRGKQGRGEQRRGEEWMSKFANVGRKMKIECREAFCRRKPSKASVDGVPRDSGWQLCHSGGDERCQAPVESQTLLGAVGGRWGLEEPKKKEGDCALRSSRCAV